MALSPHRTTFCAFSNLMIDSQSKMQIKQPLVQLRCLQWRQHQLEGNWNPLRSSLSLSAQNAIRSACKSEAWVGYVDHHKAQRSAAPFAQKTRRAMTVCDELHTAGCNMDWCSLVWDTRTNRRFLIGLLLVTLFTVLAIKHFRIDKYMPRKERSFFQ